MNELRELIRRWYDEADRDAVRVLIDRLPHDIPPEFKRAIGDEAEDVVQRTLVKLLDRTRRYLDGKDNPLAYTQRTLRRSAIDILRQRRKAGLPQSVEDWEEEAFDRRSEIAGLEVASMASDVDRALEIAASLGTDQRLAVFLRCSPGAMTELDWQEVRERHSLAPTRPVEPLDSDGASRLLWPPEEPESKEDRRRRLERFRKVFERACREIRVRWQG